ncbi:endonuclease/exonuclease/phosphatase family protein [Streptomyces sp. NPDC018347]|uniref:endonuclease/exonuclease/phosphatase family protein n=1 Tax=Streptomyces sp. NPDC018347 TaxID=3157193 RepID=UPI0033F89D74
MRDAMAGGPVTDRLPAGAGPDAPADGSGSDGPRAPGGRGPRRTLLALTVLWTLFVLLNLTLSGHWWPWLVFSLVPPLAYPAGSLALLVVAAAVRRVRARATVVLAVLALALACPQSGLVPSVLWYRAPHPGVPVRIVAWNTEYWDQGEDPATFYTRLRGLHADVYMLSEYLNYRDGEVVPINDRPRLDRAFPGYHVVVKGQLVTLSRFPVASVPVTDDPDVLRVDVIPPGGARLSVYNVHVPAQLDPTASPLSGTFWSTLRDRARDRGHSYAGLRTSALADGAPGVIAGDFNTTASMGDLRRTADLGQDAARAGGTPLPLSWNAHQAVQLWKLDWMFTRHGFAAADYRLLAPWGASDHRVQILDARDPKASS